MKIGGLQKLTLIDYPGKIACAVFCFGCSFRCPWCYNPMLVLPEKNSAFGGKNQFHPVRKKSSNGAGISQKKFFNFLKERKNLLEGVTIGGGEPTLNQELPNFIKKIKKFGFLIKLDTNGSNPEMLEKLITTHLLDYIAMDIKAPFKNQKSKIKNQKYNKATGVKVNLNKIKKSIEIIKNSGLNYEFRTTVVPGLLGENDILEIARQIKGAKKYILQQFQPKITLDKRFEKVKPYQDVWFKNVASNIKKYLTNIELRI